MPAVLCWSVYDQYDDDETPNAPLIWNHDPNVIDMVGNELGPLKEYVERLSFAIMQAGYDYSKERAACFALLSLVPKYRGELPQSNYNGLRYLMATAGAYLQTTIDQVATEDSVAVSVKEVIFGNLWRALLADAENQMPLHQWSFKVSFYLELTGPKTKTRGYIWLSNWFPDIGWIGLMTGSVLTTPDVEGTAIGITRPDLAAMLCMYGCENYAEVLVLGGYDLIEYILYAFQPNFWGDHQSAAIDLKPLARLCTSAVKLREEQIQNPVFDPTSENMGVITTDPDEQDAWQEGNHDAKTLQTLLRMGTEKSASPEEMIAIQAAMKYLVTFPNTINLGN